ncbi:hypothetical protein ACICHK_41075 [Streptomyces sp. AHU1]|uniref:hypothetical protein n=1 Tax=Streptomyces sp. AHU1 TaxID=3377215 RepID=UPI003877E3FA
MNEDADLVLDAARALRGELLDLADGPDAEERATLDRELAALLAAAAGGTEVEQDLLDLMGRHPAIHAWTIGFLTHGQPADASTHHDRDLLGGDAPPSRGEPVRAPKFLCPQGDTVWYRRSVGQPVPKCRTHGEELQPTGAEAG